MPLQRRTVLTAPATGKTLVHMDSILPEANASIAHAWSQFGVGLQDITPGLTAIGVLVVTYLVYRVS